MGRSKQVKPEEKKTYIYNDTEWGELIKKLNKNSKNGIKSRENCLRFAECGASFRTALQLTEHIRSCHPSEYPKSVNEDNCKENDCEHEEDAAMAEFDRFLEEQIWIDQINKIQIDKNRRAPRVSQTLEALIEINFFHEMMALVNQDKYLNRIPSTQVNDSAQNWLSLFQKFLNSNLTSDQFDKFIQAARSDRIQSAYNSYDLKDYYLQPEYFDLKNEENGRSCKYSYVSIISICKKYLQNQSLLKHILHEKYDQKANESNGDKLYKSFKDGKIFQRVKGSLKIEIFLDDANISPGNNNQNQKYLKVYVTFNDLPFQFRTQSDDIELLLSVNRKQLNSLEFENPLTHLFKILRDDLKTLVEEGIEVKITTMSGEEKIEKIPVSLCSVCGDNLGIYELLGFKMCFNNAAFICRYCLAAGKTKKPKPKKITKRKKKPIIETLPNAALNEVDHLTKGESSTQEGSSCVSNVTIPSSMNTGTNLTTNPGIAKASNIDKILTKVKERNLKEIERIKNLKQRKKSKQFQEFIAVPNEERSNDESDDIQHLNIYRKLIDPSSKDFSYQNLTFLREFAFDGLPWINRWNLAAPDVTHDLSEGVCPFILELILTSFVLEHQTSTTCGSNPLKGLSKEVIDRRFRMFKYFEGSGKLKWIAKEGFRMCGKAVQKLEAFLKLPAILFDVFDTNSLQFKLWNEMKDFTVLSFSQCLTVADLEEMRRSANSILELSRELGGSDVFCKLHHLTHYGDLVELFGPLYYYSTFRYERKHQYSKYIARVMRNFINPSKTIHEKHQIRRALIEKKINFEDINFFQTNKPKFIEPRFQSWTNSDKSFDSNFQLLLSCERPYPLNKNVLRKCPSTSTYFHTTQFYKEISTGRIFCLGDKFSNHWNATFDSKVRKQVQLAREKRRKDGLKYLTKSKGKYYIPYEDLNHTNDFLFENKNSYFLLECRY